ncbi:MAG: cobalamin biosynthesis protein, partial [Burkholderiales bacterium]|nr:cobalamin biosynthesis protein [Burkholderiales bacterium]
MTHQTDQTLVLGLGCDRGTMLATLQEAVTQALQQLGASVNAV